MFASPLRSELMNASILVRSASIQGAMLPLMSTINTMSATPFVFAFSGGAEVIGAGSPKTGLAGWRLQIQAASRPRLGPRPQNQVIF